MGSDCLISAGFYLGVMKVFWDWRVVMIAHIASDYMSQTVNFCYVYFTT